MSLSDIYNANALSRDQSAPSRERYVDAIAGFANLHRPYYLQMSKST